MVSVTFFFNLKIYHDQLFVSKFILTIDLSESFWNRTNVIDETAIPSVYLFSTKNNQSLSHKFDFLFLKKKIVHTAIDAWIHAPFFPGPSFHILTYYELSQMTRLTG